MKTEIELKQVKVENKRENGAPNSVFKLPYIEVIRFRSSINIDLTANFILF